MKELIFILFSLIWLQDISSPVGIWEFKEDNTRVEIKTYQGKLTGELISSDNPHRKGEKEILRNMEFLEGKWVGEFYNHKSKRWVQAEFLVKEDILFITCKYGFDTKNFHFYREK
ncbi:hypothetical protein LZ575_04790 [Antarcticibacterium sp. 1MA-6-2]|uniref:hypothetical protein n=1 Tax=Antarcticibacterium sp. 1MA-6-2 TaxID=2908210 RepID=UPI001F40AB2B|nr:hypothetical protein [Antarcticibacterium sp. 1MA-6-2]UJH91956.1 hypothetical protein LZ575_04790 [Antarcticibacterium sp. 1MA-6-2]